jgi:outer membrane murein-binding lipoprotein Lpp
VTLELILSIAGLTIGSGILIKLFASGAWKGTNDAKVDQLRKDLDSLKAEIAKSLETLKTDKGSDIVRLHQRVDELLAGRSEESSMVQSLFAGAAAQRQDWDQLRSDVRGLLQGGATTGVEIVNLKARLQIEEAKVSNHSETLAELRVALSRLDRLEDELHRTKR